MSQTKEKRPQAKEIKAEKQPYPAKQSAMELQPDSDLSNYSAAGKLTDKVALITGADSGIGRAVAIAFCKEARKWRFYTTKIRTMRKKQSVCAK